MLNSIPVTAIATLDLGLPNEPATKRLAAELAMLLGPGDVIGLSGELGAGKTTFARALIRCLANDERLEVPSPTFTLVQHYDLPRCELLHADLYRIKSDDELEELALDESERAILLVEWPERVTRGFPCDRLDIELAIVPKHGPDHRRVRLTGLGSFAPRVARMKRIRDFLGSTSFKEAERRFLQGDASTRAYERLTLASKRAILMNAPRRPDGPPVRNGKPYSAIAHLAEDVAPFVAMARGLRAEKLSAPEIYAADLEAGLLLVEDLGADLMVTAEPPSPIPERYQEAVNLLAALHARVLPRCLPIERGRDYAIPSYDQDAFLIEAELLLEWYLPLRGVSIPASLRAEFGGLWKTALREIIEGPQTWVLRDFHSPNLLWLSERTGIARVGLLDFQDAVIGPAPYDVAALLQDARVDVPEALELALLGAYAKARRAHDKTFDMASFTKHYATLGAQRATKILGIFARLNARDGKSLYLGHLPRVWNYLQRSLSHPNLRDLKAWYKANAPAS